MSLDLDRLLAPVSDDAPAGEDLSQTPEFVELEVAYRKHFPQETMIEGEVKAEPPPPFPDLLDRTLDLAHRTRDLRLAGYLLWSAIRVDGFEGLRDGLALIHGLIERFWSQGLHPVPEEMDDPWERTKVLEELDAKPSKRGMFQVQASLREVPIAHTKQHGRISYLETMVARGEIPAEALDEPVDPGRVSACLKADEPERLQERSGLLEACEDLTRQIESQVLAQAPSASVGLGQLRSLIGAIRGILDEELAARGYGSPAPGEAVPDEGAAGGTGAPAQRQGISGEVTSRQEVLLALDKILRYYESNEPGSPVPLFVRAAQKLVTMSFYDIMEKLDRDTMSRVKEIGEPE